MADSPMASAFHGVALGPCSQFDVHSGLHTPDLHFGFVGLEEQSASVLHSGAAGGFAGGGLAGGGLAAGAAACSRHRQAAHCVPASQSSMHGLTANTVHAYESWLLLGQAGNCRTSGHYCSQIEASTSQPGQYRFLAALQVL